MTLKEAIKARHSVRAYREEPLTAEQVAALEAKIEEVNAEGGLHVQLMCDEPRAFSCMLARYGRFRGVKNYLVMAGRKDEGLDRRVGYYGEQLVLLAQTLGLNTCWVGVNYSKVDGTYTLDGDEKIACYIAIGRGETQGCGHKIKSVEKVSNADTTTPAWFREGVEAALLAPTSINQQKFRFEFIPAEDGGKPRVRATHARFSLIGYLQMDLGIACCHFEIGAGKENFEWHEDAKR